MKTIRKINVKGIEYCWSVRSKNIDLIHLGIWSTKVSGQKLNIKLKFDDPWLNYGPMISSNDPEALKKAFNTKPIAPKEVSDIIQSALEFGWQPDVKGTELYLVWDRNNKAFKKLTAEEYKSLNTFYSE